MPPSEAIRMSEEEFIEKSDGTFITKEDYDNQIEENDECTMKHKHMTEYYRKLHEIEKMKKVVWNAKGDYEGACIYLGWMKQEASAFVRKHDVRMTVTQWNKKQASE